MAKPGRAEWNLCGREKIKGLIYMRKIIGEAQGEF
jgi:hypothetical protein